MSLLKPTNGFIALAAAALLLAGCAQMRSMMSGSDTHHLRANLAAANEVPPNGSNGTGTADVTYNEDTRELTWDITFSDLTGPATAAHFHGPATREQNADVQVPLGGQGVESPIQGNARLDEQQADDLLAGRWYVNIHTAEHPNGEIRGQVVPAM